MPAMHFPHPAIMRDESSSARGFTLIELMIGLAIMSLLLALALPGLRDWVQSGQIRATSESILNGLQLARSEAVRRNTSVDLLFTSTEPTAANMGALILTTSGPNWLIRVNAGTNAADFIQGRNTTEGTASALVAASASTYTFTPLGRLNGAAAQIDISNPGGGNCATAGGPMRCLRIVVEVGGGIRMCDPALDAASTSPQKCN